MHLNYVWYVLKLFFVTFNAVGVILECQEVKLH